MQEDVVGKVGGRKRAEEAELIVEETILAFGLSLSDAVTVSLITIPEDCQRGLSPFQSGVLVFPQFRQA